MRQFKLLINTHSITFEKNINEFIQKYPDAKIDYKPVMGDNSSTVHYTALIEYNTSENVTPTILNEETK